MIESLREAIQMVFASVEWHNFFLGIFTLALGQLIIRIIEGIFNYFYAETRNRQRRFLLKKIIVYTLNIFFIFLFLKVLGVDFKVILGAAGVITVAFGFAARASISNLISGIFLIFERPFVVGDVIEVQGVAGEVLSIDLLSMSLRTLDNVMVRIPNDMVMGHPVRNITYFPIRQILVHLQLPLHENLEAVHRVCLNVAEKSDHTLEEPDPEFEIEKLGENSVTVTFAVWAPSKSFRYHEAEFCKALLQSLKKAGIEQPHARVKYISEVEKSP